MKIGKDDSVCRVNAFDKHEALKELVEESDGWWFKGGKSDGEYLGINCYSCIYAGCTVRLNSAPKTANH